MIVYVFFILNVAIYGNCCQDVYNTTLVEDYSSIYGVYEYRHQYTTDIEETKSTDCAKIVFSAPLPEDIEIKDKYCGELMGDVKLEAKINWLDYTSWIFIASSRKGVHIYNPDMACLYTVAGFQMRSVTDNFILFMSPLGNSKLFVKEQVSQEEYDCVVNNIDVVKGKSGYELCHKEIKNK